MSTRLETGTPLSPDEAAEIVSAFGDQSAHIAARIAAAISRQRVAPVRRTLTCACCSEAYPQRGWTCCAPPAGMQSSRWSARWCSTCHPSGLQGARRCPRHCTCPKPEIATPAAMERYEQAIVAGGPSAAELLRRTVAKIAASKAMPKDWGLAAAGEREPGSDD